MIDPVEYALLAKTKRILEIERNSRHEFCPDCRDKVRGEPCLRCQRQRLEAELAKMRVLKNEIAESRVEKVREIFRLKAEMENLAIQRDKLWEALEKIIDDLTSYPCSDDFGHIIRIARDALGGG